MQVAVRPIRGRARRRLRGLGSDSLFADAGALFSAVSPYTVIDALNAEISTVGSSIQQVLPTWAGGTAGQLTPDQVKAAAADEAYNVAQASAGRLTISQAYQQATQDQTALARQNALNPPPLPWWANPWLWLAGAGALVVVAREL
jgi:hypothetical protein